MLFDCRGPQIDVDADEQALRRSLSRLSHAAVAMVDEGSLFMTAHAGWNDAGLADVSISIAGAGGCATAGALSSALQQLELAERSTAPDAPAGSRVAHGVCPITGAPISFGAEGDQGILFALDLVMPARLQPAAPMPSAGGASAWLLSSAPQASWSLMRRLQRLGWRTTHFESAQHALQQLRAGGPAAAPALVVGIASNDLQAEDLQPMRPLLAADVPLILGTLEPAAQAGAVDCRPWPFSPADLIELTQRVSQRERSADDTQPAALISSGWIGRPRAVVVDDNEVNLLVASGLLQLAGFDVQTARSGEEGIERCRTHLPQWVLMDVHMPGMDGLQTTRRLRRMQHEGTLAHFPIVAATADTTAVIGPACREAGMDGTLSKPLSLRAIEREIDRLLPGLRSAATTR